MKNKGTKLQYSESMAVIIIQRWFRRTIDSKLRQNDGERLVVPEVVDDCCNPKPSGQQILKGKSYYSNGVTDGQHSFSNYNISPRIFEK